MTKPSEVVSLVGFFVLMMLAFAACGVDLSESTAKLLVPDDDDFRSQWMFEPVDGPDNHAVFSHWDPSYNPDIDLSLTITGYQVSDPAAWSGRHSTEDDATHVAFVGIVADSLNEAGTDNCTSLDGEPQILSCTYDVGRDTPLTILSRVVDSASGRTVIFVPGPPLAGERYLRGSFSEYDPADAKQWLR